MKVTIARAEDGDWEGIYVDGELKAEGHILDYSDILEALEIEYTDPFVDISYSGFLPESEKNLVLH